MTTKSLIALLLLSITLWLFPAFAAAETCQGFKLPNGSSEVSKNRYLISKSWEQTLKFYRRAYGGQSGVKSFKSVSVPGVKSVHYKNLTKKGRWQGANVSRIKGKVYVFCYTEDTHKEKSKKNTKK